MKRAIACVCGILLSLPVLLLAETPDVPAGAPSAAAAGSAAPAAATATISPLSRLAIGGGVSVINGINLQAATNISSHFNVRVVGNVFKYNVNNLSSKGFSGSANLNLASFGAALDYYPWARHGLRISPGLLFYNQNTLNGSGTVTSGQSFKLNGTTYYSSTTQPVAGNLSLGVNGRNPAFTMSIGWGNMIPRSGGHWSFPFEVGAIFVGPPTLNATLTGTACTTSPTTGCVNAATDPTLQSNLTAQLVKSRNDVNVLQYWPILSFGVTYSFRVR